LSWVADSRKRVLYRFNKLGGPLTVSACTICSLTSSTITIRFDNRKKWPLYSAVLNILKHLKIRFLLTFLLTLVADYQLATAQTSDDIFRIDRINALVTIVLFSIAILLYTKWAKEGKPLFIRKIAGLDAVEEAVGRATEMGKPVLFVPGIQEIDDIETIAGISILGRVAKITAQYDTPLVVPVRYPMVLAAGQEVVEQAYIEMGKRDSYNRDIVRYVAGEQFAFTATVNGMMMRDRPAANIYMGAFFAESLLLAETGNAAGSIQIAGTARPEQLPFFIAACDYTLMGEELYAASAYLSHEPLMLGGLKGQDLMKVLIIVSIIIGVVLMTLGFGDAFRNLFEAV
jgi:hypothetical protein